MVALAVVVAWFARRTGDTDPTFEAVSVADTPADQPMLEPSSPNPQPAANSEVARSEDGVIDHPDCRFMAGRGAANDTGLFILPGDDDARFLMRDEDGTLFGDDLPFVPRMYDLGKRDDGVLAVLGDMRIHDRDSQAPQLHGHARVYRDGQIIYENERLWDFGIASDGSSFFAIEPLAGETSRLVLHNLDEGAEHHFDLGRQMTYFGNHGRTYGAYYSSDRSEVVLAPPQELNDSPRGHYWFYANDGSGPRVFRIRSMDVPLLGDAAVGSLDPRQVRDEPILRGGARRSHPDRVHFVSSELAYHILVHSPDGRQVFEIRKSIYRGYGEDGGPQRRDLWSREIQGDSYPRGQFVSDNGAWVAMEDRYRAWALDAYTGEVVFAFPTDEDLSTSLPRDSTNTTDSVVRASHLFDAYRMAAVERLRNVLGPDATVGDLGGRSGSLRLRGDRLMISRRFGRGSQTRSFYDVFDLATVGVDGPPLFRIPAIRDCRNAARTAWATMLDR